jgi:phosphate acetyltransferase
VREGKAEALMKGSLHTDELMGAVVRRETGLRTARRVSHCFVMDVPSYAETLIVTDAAVNIAPTLEDKVHITQNAIDLAHAMRMPEVRVAILSAMETVNPKVPSTIEAAALCKMADRGQITGALLDGPLALDNAINLESVKIKKIDSLVLRARGQRPGSRSRATCSRACPPRDRPRGSCSGRGCPSS